MLPLGAPDAAKTDRPVARRSSGGVGGGGPGSHRGVERDRQPAGCAALRVQESRGSEWVKITPGIGPWLFLLVPLKRNTLKRVCSSKERPPHGYGSKLNHQELDRSNFGPCFHLPCFHFGYRFLTHSQLFLPGVDSDPMGRVIAQNKEMGHGPIFYLGHGDSRSI